MLLASVDNLHTFLANSDFTGQYLLAFAKKLNMSDHLNQTLLNFKRNVVHYSAVQGEPSK